MENKKVKTVGESASYKNCKATFKFSGDKIQNTEKLDECITCEKGYYYLDGVCVEKCSKDALCYK